MNSNEEREYFLAYGWEQDLVARTWTAPRKDEGGAAVVMTFDAVMDWSHDLQGESMLRHYIRIWGERSRVAE